jgi:hypothetical protein
MKYLKRFIINEKSGDNCDFETFKDIMLELTDNYHNVVFSIPEEWYYQCQFKLYDTGNLDFDLPRIDLHSIVGYIDSPDDIEYSLDNDVIYKRVDNYINNLEDFKNNIDNIIESFSKIKEVFKNIEDYILPRFKHFDNFQACSVGFDELEGNFIITFDTDEYED